MREVDTGDVEPLRYAIPHGLQKRARVLGKWMRLVGFFQACVAGLAFAMLGFGAVSSIIRLGVFQLSNVLMLLLLGMLAMLFRQALLLQFAADHFTDISAEPADAHDHLNLAFSRLRPVFVIDLAIGVLMLLRNAATWMGS
ncbi:MAG: hypothetical protein IAG13_08735 [Deltaproteobacteria bacterium]|nr:hypothetical protein [Nannocystaceae bacterium]